MPYSFTKIEEDKTMTIGLVFFFLIIFYFVVFWLIALLAQNFLFTTTSEMAMRESTWRLLNGYDTLKVLAAAFIIGWLHWTHTTYNLLPRAVNALKARPLDKNDTYHQTFANIIEEVSVATGGRRIEGAVIHTAAMNAFALADFQGRAVIGVTEGLLARLTRAQLEAVVGHEAAHIIQGDCLATTVTSSLFALYGALLRGFNEVLMAGGRGMRYSSRGRSGGSGAAAFILLVYALLAFTALMSALARMFISRQREYRADAVAARLTRDPLSLAEALYAIAFRWRGAGLPAQAMESIFIVNPSYAVADERSGFVADLFSTHPPITKRLQILLDMAHMDAEAMAQEVERKNQRPRVSVPTAGAADSSFRWMAHRDGKWEGPFELTQFLSAEWLKPETWVQRLGTKNVTMAYEDDDIRKVVQKKAPDDSAYQCPRCAVALSKIIYEGTEVFKCPFCQGTLVGHEDAQKIIIRPEVGFTDKIIRIAAGIKEEQKKWREAVIRRDPKTLFPCPRCRHPRERMMRMFYTAAYHVEIDKCFSCGLIWFDRDEFEVLQYMMEHGSSAK
jgi:heat shock protein HtpX